MVVAADRGAGRSAVPGWGWMMEVDAAVHPGERQCVDDESPLERVHDEVLGRAVAHAEHVSAPRESPLDEVGVPLQYRWEFFFRGLLDVGVPKRYRREFF